MEHKRSVVILKCYQHGWQPQSTWDIRRWRLQTTCDDGDGDSLSFEVFRSDMLGAVDDVVFALSPRQDDERVLMLVHDERTWQHAWKMMLTNHDDDHPRGLHYCRLFAISPSEHNDIAHPVLFDLLAQIWTSRNLDEQRYRKKKKKKKAAAAACC
jgi:hypothetical protein